MLISSQNGHVGVVEVLLKNGANIEAAYPVGVRGSVVEVVVGVEVDVWFVLMMCVVVWWCYCVICLGSTD